MNRKASADGPFRHGVTAPARTGKAVRMAKLWKIGRSGRNRALARRELD